jgi:hypothetical protein
MANSHNQTDKKLKGKFFTTTNPFHNVLFLSWLDALLTKHGYDHHNFQAIEPFAGANNIVMMINDLGYCPTWQCYDIDPPAYNNSPNDTVIQRDVLNAFPSNGAKHLIAITNPPYLAKNSAKRDGLSFPDTQYDDLYKLSLDVLLQHSQYVAAIIPESFLTSSLFHNRLFGVVSLNCKMFDDTEVPVCLALFSPAEEIATRKSFDIYRGNVLLGNYEDLLNKKRLILGSDGKLQIQFNAPKGSIGLIAIDSKKGASIQFVHGTEIDPRKVKSTGRSITRLSIDAPIKNTDIEAVIDHANIILGKLRKRTHDVFLTAFKGLRDDGKYRRRLDFVTAKMIINKAVEEVAHAKT